MGKIVLTISYQPSFAEGLTETKIWGEAKVFEINQEPFLIGRTQDCQLKIDDPKASRTHCQIIKTPEGNYKLSDLESANGTFVNGRRISDIVLAPGDTIRVGDHVLCFSPEAPQQGTAPNMFTKTTIAEIDQKTPTSIPCDALKLSRYLDDELTKSEMGEIEHHLSLCAICQQTLEEWKVNDQEINAGLQNIGLDIKLVSQVLAKLSPDEPVVSGSVGKPRGQSVPKQASRPMAQVRKPVRAAVLARPPGVKDQPLKPALLSTPKPPARPPRRYVGEEIPSRLVPTSHRDKRPDWLIPVAVAAGIILVAGLFLLIAQSGKPSRGQPRPQPRVDTKSTPEIDYTGTLAQLDEKIAASERRVKEAREKQEEPKMVEEVEKIKEEVGALKAEREAMEALRRRAEERRRQEAKDTVEEQKRRVAEQGRLADLEQKLAGIKPEYEKFISRHQYTQAINLCEQHLKTLRASSSVSTDLKNQFELWLDEAQKQQQFLRDVIKKITGGPEKTKIAVGEGINLVVDKADEGGIEGWIEGKRESRITRRWENISVESIYNMFDIWEMTAEDLLNLALFCGTHNLKSQAEDLLITCYRKKPEVMGRINQLVARVKNTPIPEGGFMAYGGEWITAKDKAYLEKGYRKYNGQWMTHEEIMQAKGYVLFEGKWVTKEKKDQIEAARRRLAELAKLLAPKGLLDKSGNYKNNLPWDKAVQKATDHYLVKTNLTEDALNDLCYTMECIYLNHCKYFEVTRQTQKMPVWVFGTAEQYYQNGGPRGSGGVCGGADNKMMTFYQPGPGPHNTTGVILHEGTHQFVNIVCSSAVPIWVHEGFATYMEPCVFEGRELKVNLVNKGRLPGIRNQINSRTHVPLKDFINIPQSDYGVPRYEEGWGLVYFLINYQNGRYEKGFRDYFEAVKKGKVGIGSEGARQKQIAERHIRLFEELMGAPIDVMEEQWKEYIKKLH